MNIADQFLEHTLEAQGIPPDEFYRVVGGLQDVSFIEDVHVENHPSLAGVVRLAAKYTGDGRIGHATEGRFPNSPDPEVVQKVSALYMLIGEAVGVEFRCSRPNHVAEFCVAELHYGDVNPASAVDMTGKLELVLRR